MANGAALDINGANTTSGGTGVSLANTLYLSGGGMLDSYGRPTGALNALGGTNTLYAANMYLQGPKDVPALTGNYGTPAFNVLGVAAGDTAISSAIDGKTNANGAYSAKTGTGSLEFTGTTANQFLAHYQNGGDSDFFAWEGTLVLNKSANGSLSIKQGGNNEGYLIIGDNDGGPGNAQVAYGVNALTYGDQLPDYETVLIARSGVLNANGANDTIGRPRLCSRPAPSSAPTPCCNRLRVPLPIPRPPRPPATTPSTTARTAAPAPRPTTRWSCRAARSR